VTAPARNWPRADGIVSKEPARLRIGSAKGGCAQGQLGVFLTGARVVIPLLLLGAACKPPPDERQELPLANPARGKQAIERVGCAACHSIEGISWPKGQSAPELRGLGCRAMIAGRIPNRPDLLAAFVRNAPSLVPGTTMPPMPLTEQESRDVAAYLYEIGD